MLVHKAFHHYTVRRKQGGSQSSRDNQGNAPRSAGASLRRQQETALAEVGDIPAVLVKLEIFALLFKYNHVAIVT